MERKPATALRSTRRRWSSELSAGSARHILTETNIADLVGLIAGEMEEVESEARLKLDVVEKELGDVRR